MQPKDDRSDRELDRPLWDLLDRAQTPGVPGNFADNVLRRIRMEEAKEPKSSIGSWLAQSWKMISGLAAGVSLLAAMLVFQENHSTSRSMAVNVTPELSAMIASVSVSETPDLGEMDTSLDDNDVWLGTTSY